MLITLFMDKEERTFRWMSHLGRRKHDKVTLQQSNNGSELTEP